MAFSHRLRYIHLSLASHSMKYSQFSSGLTLSFSTSSKHHFQSGIMDKRQSHFLISYYRLIFQSKLCRLVPYSLQRMQYEANLDQKYTTLTLSIKRVHHLEYTEEIYRTEFPYRDVEVSEMLDLIISIKYGPNLFGTESSKSRHFFRISVAYVHEYISESRARLRTFSNDVYKHRRSSKLP